MTLCKERWGILMQCKGETLQPILYNEKKFFDFFPISGHPVIMSYSRINKEILVNVKAKELSFGNIKRKKEIHSIFDLREIFDTLINKEVELINRNSRYNIGINFETEAGSGGIPYRINLKHEYKKLIIEQLIFDVLADKYLTESPLMTLRQYSIYQSQYDRNGIAKNEKIESVRKCIANSIKKQIEIMNSPKLRDEIVELGFAPDEYFKYYGQVSTPFSSQKQILHEKPKVQWDYIYYNANTKLITGKQYNRSFSKNRNYSRDDLVDLFKACDQYIDKHFMQPTEDAESYFLKSLDFYYFEIYKRLDFIYKLSVRLDELNFQKIEKNNIFVKRFVPEVYDVLDQSGSLKFGNRKKYYKPMLMLETVWLQKLREEPVDIIKWHNLYFIRAKVYELFKYHFRFASNDYDEISDFIKIYYNILNYHDPNKIWIQADKKLKRECEGRIIKALEINEALFGVSDKRKPTSWTPPEKK